jgi:hypothetical protein
VPNPVSGSVEPWDLAVPFDKLSPDEQNEVRKHYAKWSDENLHSVTWSKGTRGWVAWKATKH